MNFRVVFAVLLMILVCGCTSNPVCNKPYILVGDNCCLDRNDNKICDSDEQTTTTTTNQTTTTTTTTSTTTMIITTTTTITTTTMTTMTTTTIIDLESEKKICSLMNHPNDRRECYYNLALKSQKPLVCEEISEEGCWVEGEGDLCSSAFNRDHCYEMVARAIGDPQLCHLIETDSIKAHCYMFLAEITGESWLCSRISNLENIEEKSKILSMDYCYMAVASKTGNDRLCRSISQDMIHSNNYRHLCYVGVALKTKNAEFCNYLGVDEECTREINLYNNATKTHNISLCEKLSFDILREDCIKELANP